MEHFIVKNGEVVELTKEEFENLPGRHVSEIVKDMTPEELDRFKKERQEKFINPLMKHNIVELNKKKQD
ncbi:hypothetical protein ACFQ3N_12815 [Virgibacillus byunsanensis]|uniref:Uncharacterized protein n=1 Tax=Virgibacillus byunsanensis TaxID=570945 RepID=A0ABW3LMK5_9BACI